MPKHNVVHEERGLSYEEAKVVAAGLLAAGHLVESFKEGFSWTVRAY